MSRLTRDGTAEPVSRDQILRREREQGNINFPSSADHEQGVAARDLFCLRCSMLVTTICSDVFYGAVDSRRQKRRTRWNSRREARGRQAEA